MDGGGTIDAGNKGVLAWRTIYSIGIVILGVLSMGVYDGVRKTAESVADIREKIGNITGTYSTRLDDHERRLGKLEDWRSSGPSIGPARATP